MPRIQPLTPEEATGRSKELLEDVKKKLGMVPNLMRTMAQSPSVLQAYLQFNDSLASGELARKYRELLAVSVGEANACYYCVSAHTAIGKSIGATPEELMDARRGQGADPKIQALISLARSVVENRGQVTDGDLSGVREAGFSEGEIAEIVAHVALNTFTNYFNLVAGTEIDFPLAPELETKESCAA